MAELDETARTKVWSDLMKRYSEDGESINVTKADLRAAVDALDSYLDDNAGDINNALPNPAKSELTQSQKALLLSYVVLKRYEVI